MFFYLSSISMCLNLNSEIAPRGDEYFWFGIRI